MSVHNFAFYDVIKRNAARFPQYPAWHEVSNNRSLTFGEFKDMVDRLATGLQQAGLKKGDRLCVLGKNSLEYLLVYGAAGALGGIVLAINWRLSPDEVLHNVVDVSPRFFFIDREFEALAKGMAHELPSVEHYYNLNGGDGVFSDFQNLLENKGEFRSEMVTADDGLVIMHTAAVTGRPMGALLTHGNVLSSTTQLGCSLNLSPEDVHITILPFFHMAGFWLMMSAFHAGVLNVNIHKFDAEQVVHLIEEKKISVLFSFSPILGSILEQQENLNADITSLKNILGLESPEAIEKYKNLTGGRFFTGYGQTEVSSFVTMGPYIGRPGFAGRPVPMADVRIIDDNDNEVSPGQRGEIVVKGPMVFKGYWNRLDVNESKFRSGFYRTGDLGLFDEQGFLWYEGRKAEKDLIKTGGENVYPVEVEETILLHPAIDKVVVLGVPDDKWGEAIKAVCQLKEGQGLEAHVLVDFVAQRIARYKKPYHVVFVEELACLNDGSPDRDKVKADYGLNT